MKGVAPKLYDRRCADGRLIGFKYAKNGSKSQFAGKDLCQLWAALSMAEKMGA
jgi:hypothetical protein